MKARKKKEDRGKRNEEARKKKEEGTEKQEARMRKIADRRWAKEEHERHG